MSKVNDLKQENEIKIRECLYDGQIWTKNDLAYKTSLSLATTTNILQEMLKNHEIEYVSDSKSTGGRKSKEYQLYKDYKHLLKIVLKKNKKNYEFIFEIIDLYDQIVYQKNYSSLKGTVEEFLKMLKEVLKKDQEIVVICLSLPGVCDQGMIDLCDFEDFQNKNILEILKKEIKQRIIIENDVNCASIGFYHQYPHFVETLNNRYLNYNASLDLITKLEKEKKIFVLRPSQLIPIGRLEKDKEVIQQMYDLGVCDCNNQLENLKKYLRG